MKAQEFLKITQDLFDGLEFYKQAPLEIDHNYLSFDEIKDQNIFNIQLKNKYGYYKYDKFHFKTNYNNFTLKIPKSPENLIKNLVNAYKNSLVYSQRKEEFLKAFQEKNANYFNDYFIYPTAYGFGYFCLLFRKSNFDDLNQKLSDFLKEKNISFKNEYSDAGWVYRYKIKSDKISNQIIVNEIKNIIN